MSPVRLVLGLKHGPNGWWDVHPTLSQLVVSVWMFIVSLACLVSVGLALHSAQRANTLAHTIQAQRRQSLVDACQATNTRYENAVRQLETIRSHALKSSPEAIVRLFRAAGITITDAAPIVRIERASIKANFTQEVLLINALVPDRPNCARFARVKVTS